MPGIEINKRIVLINSVSSAVSLVLNLSVLVWLQQYLLKRISPEEYSLIPIIAAVMAFTPLLTMVLTSGLGRYTTVAYAKNDTAEVTRICSTMFPILMVAGLVFLVLGGFAAWQIDKILDIPDELVREAQIMMGLLVLLSAVQLPLETFSSGFVITQKLLIQDMINIGCQFFRIALLFILLFGFGTHALWVTAALVASEFLRLAIATPLSIHYIPSQKPRRSAFSWSLAKEITGYGGWGFVSQLGETLRQSMDPILLNRFSTAVEVAVYNVAGIVPRQIQQLLTPITRPFFPVLASLCATEDFGRLNNTYLRTARYHAWVLLFFSVPVIIFNKELMHLYLGGKYDAAGGIMALLLLVTILSSFNALGPAIMAAAGIMKGFSLRRFAQQLINFAFTVILVVFLRKGAYGSAMGTLLASVFYEIFFVWPFCRKIAHTPTKTWIIEVLLPTIAPAIPSIIFCIAIKVFVSIDSWLSLFATSAISGLLYFIIVVLFGLRQQDKIDIVRISDKTPGPVKTILKFITRE